MYSLFFYYLIAFSTKSLLYIILYENSITTKEKGKVTLRGFFFTTDLIKIIFKMLYISIRRHQSNAPFKELYIPFPFGIKEEKQRLKLLE